MKPQIEPGALTEAPDVSPLAGNGRLVGLAAGDVVRVGRAEIDSLLKRAEGNRTEAFQLGVARLRDANLITAPDAERLSEIGKILPLTTEAPFSDETVAKVQAVYYELIADSQASAVTLAIVSGIVGALSAEPPQSDGATLRVSTTTVGMVIGASVGGFIGGLFGNGLGAAAGATIGAGIGGGYGSCFE